MIERKFSSNVKKRTDFFNCFFNKGMGYIGNYNSITSMIFDKKHPIYNLYNNSENHTKSVTQNIHNRVESISNIYPIIELNTSLNALESKQELTYKTSYVDNSSVDNSIELFNNAIIEKFTKFNTQNHKRIEKQVLLNPVTHNHFTTKSMFSESLQIPTETSTTMVHQKDKEPVQVQAIKEIEEKLLHQVEEKIKVVKKEKRVVTMTHEERIVQQREEKKVTDKIYTMVMKRWDKELSRKGHLYG